MLINSDFRAEEGFPAKDVVDSHSVCLQVFQRPCVNLCVHTVVTLFSFEQLQRVKNLRLEHGWYVGPF